MLGPGSYGAGGAYYAGFSATKSEGVIIAGFSHSTGGTTGRGVVRLTGAIESGGAVGATDRLMTVDNAGTVKVTVLGNGKVGILDDNPAYELTVGGNVGATGQMYFPNIATGGTGGDVLILQSGQIMSKVFYKEATVILKCIGDDALLSTGNGIAKFSIPAQYAG